MKDSLRPFVPEYKGHIMSDDGECILIKKFINLMFFYFYFSIIIVELLFFSKKIYTNNIKYIYFHY